MNTSHFEILDKKMENLDSKVSSMRQTQHENTTETIKDVEHIKSTLTFLSASISEIKEAVLTIQDFQKNCPALKEHNIDLANSKRRKEKMKTYSLALTIVSLCVSVPYTLYVAKTKLDEEAAKIAALQKTLIHLGHNETIPPWKMQENSEDEKKGNP